MAQKKWELKEEDMTIAYIYISRGLKSDRLFKHRDNDIYTKARDEFFKVTLSQTKGKDAYLSAFKNWINKYFDDIQLKRLRVKIRVERSSWRNHRKQMTIDSNVHYRLSQYANRHNVTLSEAIERLLHLTTSENKPF